MASTQHQPAQGPDSEQKWGLSRIVSHRRVDSHTSSAGHTPDRFELQVLWDTGEKTWEPETSVHQDAPDATLQYWESLGGRLRFMNETEYWIPLSIVKHRLQEENPNNEEEYLIQWVGARDRTWEKRGTVPRTLRRDY
ncbi:chromo domain-containing protein [Colletotrichum sp. SAR 10_86]|nr:chromo domain-containing protein [Colletotrichum sp. SAR 10_75]KAI8181643.1 chromo domain-containing protein [Colletotrichum sp. SAR 10_65]KAI8209915.1 chromo domain-containing protein [Colletotrichum sp. SAR 10_76]KAI8231294.1 chromo domain-containing protein [Colletotrichum sp. SAR 10_86]